MIAPELFDLKDSGNIQRTSARTDHGVELGAADRLAAVAQLSDDAQDRQADGGRGSGPAAAEGEAESGVSIHLVDPEFVVETLAGIATGDIRLPAGDGWIDRGVQAIHERGAP